MSDRCCTQRVSLGDPAITDEQRSGVEVCLGLSQGGSLVNRAADAQSDVAVGIYKTRQNPALQHHVRRDRGALEGQNSVHRPQPAPLVVRRDEHRSTEFDDVGHGKSVAGEVPRSLSPACDWAAVRSCGSFVYDHTGAPAGAEIGLTQSATVEPVRVMPAKEVSIPLSTTETQHSPVQNQSALSKISTVTQSLKSHSLAWLEDPHHRHTGPRHGDRAGTLPQRSSQPASAGLPDRRPGQRSRGGPGAVPRAMD